MRLVRYSTCHAREKRVGLLHGGGNVVVVLLFVSARLLRSNARSGATGYAPNGASRRRARPAAVYLAFTARNTVGSVSGRMVRQFRYGDTRFPALDSFRLAATTCSSVV